MVNLETKANGGVVDWEKSPNVLPISNHKVDNEGVGMGLGLGKSDERVF